MDICDISDCKVAVCDDSITNVMILSKLLESEGIGHVHTFTDPRRVVPFLREQAWDIDLLILDIEMPHMSGLEMMAAIAAEHPGQLPFAILIITGLNDRDVRHSALLAGANDFVDKPFDQTEVVLRTRNLLQVQRALKAQTQLAHELELKVAQRTEELDRANNLLIQLLALAGELRDNETGRHVARVGRYSRILAEGVGLPADLCFLIEKAAPLHDIGKIGIPDAILHKNGELDAAERQVMDGHTTMGLRLLGEYGQDSMLIQIAAGIALNHHERWDGRGYPRRLHGESIPIEGRIVAIADVFDALTSRRRYKAPWPLDRVEAFMRENSGSHFDPALIEVFCSNIDRFAEVMTTLADEPEDGNEAAYPEPTLDDRSLRN